MRFLYQYGRVIEWLSAAIIVATMLLFNFGLVTQRGAAVVSVSVIIIYWLAVVPRIIHEKKSP
ncbi:hypothetical protein [Lactiplantibacillus modestisalitolerans]|uniref:Integral membrane protein n=1 Tax=Lactiplantibacillus modestisalitolerans TaxID=1457219 RepID=A0ABV5WVR4_9LACO|nr:hypothetical protein [Lactiplantibacillus modestisalitolerans]